MLQRVLELKDFTTICSSAPSEVLALIGLRRCVEGAAVGRQACWHAAGVPARCPSVVCRAAFPHHAPCVPPACSYDALVQRSLGVIQANLETLDAFFARWSHVIAWRRPSAGTVAFPRLLTGEGVEAWCEAAVQQAGVLLMPASVYGDPSFTQQGHFRLGFGRRDLPQCLEHLEAFLMARYPPPPPPAQQ